jgi:hypothetical protein
MNKLLLPITLISMIISSHSFGQTEPDSTDYNKIERLEITKDRDGVKLQVQTFDSITGEVKDTTKITMKKSTIYIVTEDNYEEVDGEQDEWDDRDQKYGLTNWAGIDIGVNGFLNADGDPDLGEELDYLDVNYAGSRSLSINFWEQKFRFVKDYVGLTTGAGLQWNNYRLKNDYTLANVNDSLIAFKDSSLNLNKNKFRTTWINIPLLLEFNTSPHREKSFHIAAGVVGGLNVESMYKQKYKQDGERFKHSSKNDFNVDPIRIEGMVRLGYGSFNMFATVQLNELFEEGTGPEIYPFTVGLTLVAFD